MQNKTLRILILLILLLFATGMIYDTYYWYAVLEPEGDPTNEVEQMKAMLSGYEYLYHIEDSEGEVIFDIGQGTIIDEVAALKKLFEYNEELYTIQGKDSDCNLITILDISPEITDNVDESKFIFDLETMKSSCDEDPDNSTDIDNYLIPDIKEIIPDFSDEDRASLISIINRAKREKYISLSEDDDTEIKYTFWITDKQIDNMFAFVAEENTDFNVNEFKTLVTNARIETTDVRNIINIPIETWQSLTFQLESEIENLRRVIGSDCTQKAQQSESERQQTPFACEQVYHRYPGPAEDEDIVFDIRSISYETSDTQTLEDFLFFENDMNIFKEMRGIDPYIGEDEVKTIIRHNILPFTRYKLYNFENPEEKYADMSDVDKISIYRQIKPLLDDENNIYGTIFNISEDDVTKMAAAEIEDLLVNLFWEVLQNVRDKREYFNIRTDLLDRKQGTVALGLDLAGGLHFELTLDEEEAQEDFYANKRSLLRKQYEDEYSGQALDEKIEQIIIEREEELQAEFEQIFKDQKNDILGNLNDRVNKFAISEVDMGMSQGERIYVDIPGTMDKERTRRLITKPGNLAFHIVDDVFWQEVIMNKISPEDRNVIIYPSRRDDYVLIGLNKQTILDKTVFDNEGNQITIGQLMDNYNRTKDEVSKVDLFPYVKTDFTTGLEKIVGYIPCHLVAAMSGDFIEDASVNTPGSGSMQSTGGISISFTIRDSRPNVSDNEDIVSDETFSEMFTRVTGENKGKRMAIVLDGDVRSYPAINTAIHSRDAQITGDFTMEVAEDIAGILKAAKLSASLQVVAEEEIGPSRGADNIEAGKWAALIAFLLVIVFMIIRYKIMGFIASLAVVFNLFFTIAVLAQFQFTLSLPGIFGLILTVGMSVDANVIINERIREELAAGKILTAAIDNGYKKAFSAIIDANLTTLFAAIVLWAVGVGIIKGFGVTLFWGIVWSLVSALFLTRLMVDILVDTFKLKKLWL